MRSQPVTQLVPKGLISDYEHVEVQIRCQHIVEGLWVALGDVCVEFPGAYQKALQRLASTASIVDCELGQGSYEPRMVFFRFQYPSVNPGDF